MQWQHLYNDHPDYDRLSGSGEFDPIVLWIAIPWGIGLALWYISLLRKWWSDRQEHKRWQEKQRHLKNTSATSSDETEQDFPKQNDEGFRTLLATRQRRRLQEEKLWAEGDD